MQFFHEYLLHNVNAATTALRLITFLPALQFTTVTSIVRSSLVYRPTRSRYQAIDVAFICTNNAWMNNTAPKKRITREQWLTKGLELFALSGANGIRVEQLARRLGVAKSGFYCHFKDREDLLDNILDYWAHEYTEVITENVMLKHLPARERLLLLMAMVYEQDLAEFDAAIDMWSRTDKRVARKRKRVIDQRLTFGRDALQELGFKGDDLEMRSRVLIGFQMGERQIFGFTKNAAKVHRELRLKMLIGEAV